MTRGSVRPPEAERDYDAIEAAVMETARGRWFLTEYARRNRSADTEIVLGAVARLEASLGRDRFGSVPDGLQRELIAIAGIVAGMLRGAEADASPGGASLDTNIARAGAASAGLLGSAEALRDLGRSVRDAGGEPRLVDSLEAEAAEIEAACRQQDAAQASLANAATALRQLDARLAAMVKPAIPAVRRPVERAASASLPAPGPAVTRHLPFAGLRRAAAVEGQAAAPPGASAARAVARPAEAVIAAVPSPLPPSGLLVAFPRPEPVVPIRAPAVEPASLAEEADPLAGLPPGHIEALFS